MQNILSNNTHTAPTSLLAPVIPESAPFSSEQRSWLNGFFAGISTVETSTPSTQPDTSATTQPEVDIDENADYPWHDPALAIDERLQLASDRPHPQKLMAAMAQLDCGSCGYECATYAKAIATGDDTDLTKCVPGAKATSKALKQIIKENPIQLTSPNNNTDPNNTPSSNPNQYDRNNPFHAPLVASKKLNKEGSTKDTRFISLDLTGSNLTYNVGDALGVYPQNCPTLVHQILDVMAIPPERPTQFPSGTTTTAYQALIEKVTITSIDEEQIQLFADLATDDIQRAKLLLLAEDDEALSPMDLLDLLQQFPDIRPAFDDLLQTLPPIQPRLYSICSSLKAHPDEVHLTVGVVRYQANQRTRLGVASTYLAERVDAQQTVRVFTQKAHGFAPPANPNTPMIMVGPGTGIAPFRAFLEERRALNAPGDNWLFFGDQQQSTDYLYEHELKRYQDEGLLNRIDLAFSRDQKDKIYVQDRMRQNAAELWEWLKRGAHFYVCGDAQRMAKDVDNTLKQIIVDQGNMNEDQATAYLKNMTQEGRYQRDIY